MLASSCMQRRSSKSISKNSCRTKVLLGKFTSAGGNVDKCLAASSAVARSHEESMYTASTLLTAVTDNPPCSKRSLLRRAACSQLRKRNLFSCKEAFNASQRSAAAMACLWPRPATAFSKFPCVYIPLPHLRRHESTIKYKLTSYIDHACVFSCAFLTQPLMDMTETPSLRGYSQMSAKQNKESRFVFSYIFFLRPKQLTL